MQLDPEVSVVERGIARPVARIDEDLRHVASQERGLGDGPGAVLSRLHREQSFACRHQQLMRHANLLPATICPSAMFRPSDTFCPSATL